MKKNKKKKYYYITRVRCAITGRFVKKAEKLKRPKTTVVVKIKIYYK